MSNIIQSYANGCTGLDDSSIHPNEPGLNFRVFIAKQPFTPRTCYTVPRDTSGRILRAIGAQLPLEARPGGREPSVRLQAQRGPGTARGRPPAGPGSRGGGARAGGSGAAGQLRPEPGSCGRQSPAERGPTGVQVTRVRAGTAGPAGIPSARVCPSTRLGRRMGRSESRRGEPGCSGAI